MSETQIPSHCCLLPDAYCLRMRAEWSPHAATWIAWPHNPEDWPGRFEPIPWVYVEIIRKLSRVERVEILVQDEQARLSAAAMLQRAGVDGRQVRFHEVPTDRVWTRDFAPTFVKDSEGRTVAIKWRFNAWAKYPNWQQDEAAGLAVARLRGGVEVVIPSLPLVARLCQPWSTGDTPVPQAMGDAAGLHAGGVIVLEGGSIDVNGKGTLLTTEECLLGDEQVRNPGLSRADYEAIFREYLGIEKTLWLNRGIAGDDTHGHVDDLARFVNPSTVVVVQETDREDANYEPLRENWERLQAMSDPSGRRLQVVTLPMPEPIIFDGQRLPASYANFYIANRLVMVPTFNDPQDRHALSTLAELFPDREVVGIYCGDLVWGFGTLHCMTQQQPL